MYEGDLTGAEIADFLYEVCELYDDEEIDRDDVGAVVEAAFMSSNCDDFAWLLTEVTGWPTVRMTSDFGEAGTGHHTMVRSPDGRLLDVRGWTDEVETRAYYRLNENQTVFAPWHVTGVDWTDPADESFQVMIAALKGLDVEPFGTPEFREMIERYESRIGQLQSPAP